MEITQKLLILLFLICPGFEALYAQHLPNEQLTAKYGHALIQEGFMKNVGQFTDENNMSAEGVLYGATIGQCNIFITDKGLSYINYILKGKETKPGANKLIKNDSISNFKYDIERVDISLDGANVSVAQAHETRVSNNEINYNYYTSAHKEGVSGLHPSKEILFKNVYEGIDWSIQIITGENGKSALKYNFIVRPGADIKKIKLRYSKNASLLLNDAGELTARTYLTKFAERKPVCYMQESHTQVNFRYKLNRQIISFEGPVSKFDSTFIIDPEVFWGTYLPALSGPGIISGCDIATDADASIAVSLTSDGQVPFITLNPGNGAFYQDYAGTTHGAMIIMKFNPKGKLLWSTYFSGRGRVAGNLLTIDKIGNLFAAGRAIFNNFYDTAHIPLKDNGGYFDSDPKENFITKFDLNGKLLWSTYFGGYNTDPQDMTTDNAGKLYITGWANWERFPVIDPGNGAYMEASRTTAQIVFINQFDANNKLEWSTHIQGNSYDPLARIDVDKKGNIFIGLQNRSTVFPFKNAGGYFSSTNIGYVIIKFNKDRQITWCTGVKTGSSFEFKDLVTDEEGNLYVASVHGVLWKFNEKTELVWTKTYSNVRMFFYNRMTYDKKNNLIHILGIMNDQIKDFPTKNTDCNGSFFFDDKTGTGATCPIFLTFTTDGDVQYCSLSNWSDMFSSSSNFVCDANGDLVYLFSKLSDGDVMSITHDPGDGAFYYPERNLNVSCPFLLKLKTSELNITSTVRLSTTCDSNNIINLQALCGKPPFKYLWSNGDTTSTVKVSNGKYSVKITDDNFLTKILFFEIPNPTGSVSKFKVSITDAHCNKKDGRITVNNIQGGTAPYLFSFNSGPFADDKIFTNIDSGTYFITVKDQNGCLAKDTVKVDNITGPSKLMSVVTATSCNKNDGIININQVAGGTAPYSFAINNQAHSEMAIFNNLRPAAYILSVIDSAGCELLDSALVTSSLPPDSIQLTIQPDHCLSSIGLFTVNRVFGGNSPFTFSIDDATYTNQTTFKALKSGSYSLYIKDSKSCLVKKSILVENIAGPNKIYYRKEDALCGSTTGNIQIDSVLNGNSPFSFSLDRQAFQNSTLFQKIAFGNHTVTAKDQFGCEVSAPISINYIKQYGIDILPHDTSVCYGQAVSLTVNLEDESTVTSLKWNTGEKNNTITISPSQNLPVFILVTDKNGCMIYDTAYIKVNACNTGSKCVAIPAAFTPNNDGLNDRLGPIVNGCRLTNLVFRVYNRYGTLVFETKDPTKKWDGKINNMEQPPGAYVFICNFTTDDNTFNTSQGTFVLLR